jgi:hypothetical protein
MGHPSHLQQQHQQKPHQRQQRQKQGSVALLAACTALQGAKMTQQAIPQHHKMHDEDSITATGSDPASAANAMALPVLRHNHHVHCDVLAPALY